MSDDTEDEDYKEEYNYHYVFGVRSIVNLEKDPPVELQLDFVIEYCTDDANKILVEAKEITDNKMWQTKLEDALEIVGRRDLVHLITAIHTINIRTRFCPELTTHHLKTSVKIDREILNTWLQSCIHDPYARNKLQQSKVW